MGMLEGKVAFITGGARGQGRAHAITCAREGADVVIVDVVSDVVDTTYGLATADDHAETAKLVREHGRRVVDVEADVRDQAALDAAVARAVDELGHIDIVIANAGIHAFAPFWELTEEQWDAMIGINLTGVWKTIKAATPHLIERGSGSIVVTASVNGLEATANFTHYVAAKHGVIGLAKNIALELAPHGIRCNSISPGATLTAMTDNQVFYDWFAGHEGGTRDDLIAGGHHYGAVKGTSFIDPQAMADTALYLNSDLAANVTGQNIAVDNGHLLLPGANPVGTGS
ncbi:putative NAD-dependent oxidoreductase [Pseudonocardia sulfidoxydans NBRC 16205]|uniref:Putative NAD-dependent oxidoreductase n=2 Tax=Pseudonocardia sulfidoxydans TaxID=54011 RepID=A0A511D8R0_9PSEU|nr:mycofactocin-coupled SDR family oxidoreductase [Pseudonocardia sulfidoxydans]GEL21185.1 putative NAD-dependent oxidoreductase [Pseudonocardia sulfidoxydans NBRC 16205]